MQRQQDDEQNIADTVLAGYRELPFIGCQTQSHRQPLLLLPLLPLLPHRHHLQTFLDLVDPSSNCAMRHKP